MNCRGCFIAGRQGRLYLATFGNSAAAQAVLFLPAFAEEMNLSRAVVARQARMLAECGYFVVLLDYFGTGDSEGKSMQPLYPAGSTTSTQLWHGSGKSDDSR
ncbi:hypothetical protein [Marinobacterium aestuariivivens]|uniref:Serine aminopeptidase S33 domain-containing protein n=1 Tax=Marinobacterium aestuariivivens TaxID=1698799 RepID=A0ABW1ZV11_9GAMM